MNRAESFHHPALPWLSLSTLLLSVTTPELVFQVVKATKIFLVRTAGGTTATLTVLLLALRSHLTSKPNHFDRTQKWESRKEDLKQNLKALVSEAGQPSHPMDLLVSLVRYPAGVFYEPSRSTLVLGLFCPLSQEEQYWIRVQEAFPA